MFEDTKEQIKQLKRYKFTTPYNPSNCCREREIEYLKATKRYSYEFFMKAGKVMDARLIMDRYSRLSKGVGHVEFYDEFVGILSLIGNNMCNLS